MSGGWEVVVKGARELEAALTDVVITVDPVLSRSLRALAEPVKAEVRQLAGGWAQAGPGQATTAGGVRIRRRQLTVRVEQGLSKTTGQHGNYGGVQMRHFFIPAIEHHTAEVEAGVAKVIDGLIGRV